MQLRDSGPTPPESSGSSKGPIVGAVIALIAVVGLGAYVRSSRQSDAAEAARSAAATPIAQQAAAPQPAARLGPHPQKDLPPLPVAPYAPPRPPDVVRAAYLFAAEHPEILSYVPCFCGCERGGHKGNEDCFVATRDPKSGDVTAWEPHGLDCAVCIDVATEARQMFTSGANARDIRTAIEKKWAGFHGGHTPTPEPPKSH